MRKLVLLLLLSTLSHGQIATTSLYGNGYVPPTTTMAPLFPNTGSKIFAVGDSICVGSGSSSPGGASGFTYTPANATAFETLLADRIPGTNTNRCYGGSQTADAVKAQLFATGTYTPLISDNPLFIENPGTNEWYWCELVTGNTTGCRYNAAMSQRTLDTWPLTNNNKAASAWIYSSGWSTDLRLPAYAKQTTTNGAVASTSFTVQPNTSGLCVAFEALDANGGSASLSIDGAAVDTLNAFGFNGQTVKTGFVGSTWTVWTQCYAASPGVHSIAMTVTSATSASNIFSPVAVLSPNDPTVVNYGPPRGISVGVSYQQNDTQSAVTAFYNAQKLAVVNTLAGYGFPIKFANVRQYQDPVYDFSSTTVTKPDGTVCVASTQPGAHPNDCGHADIYRAVALVAAPFGGGGATDVNSPLLIPGAAGDFSSYNSGGIASTNALNPQWCSYIANNRPHCTGLGYLSSYGTYSHESIAPVGDLFSWGFYSAGSSMPSLQSQITRTFYLSPNGAQFDVDVNAGCIKLGTTSAAAGTGMRLCKFTPYTPTLTPASVAAASCSDQAFTVTGVSLGDNFTTLRPPSGFGNVSATVLPSSANQVTIHFCNPSAVAVTPPAGQYVWMAFQQ